MRETGFAHCRHGFSARAHEISAASGSTAYFRRARRPAPKMISLVEFHAARRCAIARLSSLRRERQMMAIQLATRGTLGRAMRFTASWRFTIRFTISVSALLRREASP